MNENMKMDKTVGIITLNGYFNYGNRLQNYALEQTVISLGFKTETLLVDESNSSHNANELSKNNSANKLGILIAKAKDKSAIEIATIGIRKIKNKIFENKYRTNQKKRFKYFEKFSKFYLNETVYKLTNVDDARNIEDQYAYFVVGSDQVWNPNYTKCSPIYFLRFTDCNKRIAYAPSFSVPSIPEKYRENYKEWICDFKRISVREEDGARLIKELTGQDVSVMVDPTLLLTQQQWLKISREADHKPKKKYIVTYFLGGDTKEHRRKLKAFANRYDYEIIRLADIKDRHTYKTGPSEFIDYIKDCSIMLTDSFHGIVFSILFKRPFIAYKRRGGELMYSRIETLLDLFSLSNRQYGKTPIDENMFDIDYDHADNILAEERQRSFKFLREGFDLTI